VTDLTDANIQIRSATAGDNVLLAELGERTFANTFAAQNTPENLAAYLGASFSPEKQAAELADPYSVFLIAESDGQPAGYARLKAGQPSAANAGNNPIELVRIYATEAWIGKGLGARLMRACLAEAEKRGCDTIWLGVWEENPRAIAFYRKWGFTVTGRQTFQLGDDMQTDLIMQRPVRAPD
jgi:ribosomal protein S18 acetylase RimI-like enzyme